MKPAHQITDRAKRYRAQKNRPAGPRRCNICSSRRNVDVDHIEGDESDDSPENLWYLCRVCNTRKGLQQARNRIGVRTRQFNPERRPSFGRFHNAAMVLTGIDPGDVAQATACIRATAPETRAEYGRMIAEKNPFKSDAERRKFFAMAERGEISRATLEKWLHDYNPLMNPDEVPKFGQYAFGVSMHSRGAHDEGGKIIHATPPALRSQYARRIAAIKRGRRTQEVPF